jgi:nicotinamidase-related amidase
MTSLQEKLRPEHSAVVVVDMQNDFFHPEGAGAKVSRSSAGLYNGDLLAERLPAFLDGARAAGIVIVFVRMINDLEYLSPPVAERLDRIGLLGNGLQTGTWGADYWGEVRPDRSRVREHEVIKHRYSAFHGTDLVMLLRANRIETLAFTGVATSGCVESTARDALFNDFYGVMVSDCVADGDRESHDYSLRKYERSFGEVMESTAILDLWNARVVAVPHRAAQG